MFAWLPASLHSNHRISWYLSTFALNQSHGMFHFHFEAEISHVLTLCPITATMYIFKGSYQWTESATHHQTEEMMADLKSIELSSFTFDMMLYYCFLVVYLLMMSQSQSRTPYDVTTILYYICMWLQCTCTMQYLANTCIMVHAELFCDKILSCPVITRHVDHVTLRHCLVAV